MSELVIIITDKTLTQEMCATEETISRLGLAEYNNGENIFGVRSFSKALCLNTIATDPGKDVDVLLLPDVTFDEEFAPIIDYFTKGLKKVFILYHKNPNKPSLPEGQNKFMQMVIRDIPVNRLYQSHVSDSIYCNELKELAKAILAGDEELYRSVLRDMKAKFPDGSKEKSLALLHDCLTPDGAGSADVSFLDADQKKIVASLAVLKDNLSAEYIERLTALRESLLGQ